VSNRSVFWVTWILFVATAIALVVATLQSSDKGATIVPLTAVICFIFVLPFAHRLTRAAIGIDGLVFGLQEQVKGIAENQQTILTKQRKQDEYLNKYRFFCLLANLLHEPEKHHLRYLLRRRQNATAEEYEGRESFRRELFRLKRFGLLSERSGQKIGAMHDNRDLFEIVNLTPFGVEFVETLSEIESG
jgi:hypothetical protein